MPDRLLWGAVLLAALICTVLPAAGDVLLGVAAAAALCAGVTSARRAALLRMASGLLWGALIALAVLLLGDRFDLRYVWIYSGAELPLHLKLANLWGGDEGTTLLLAAFLASLAARGAASRSQRVDVAALLAAWYALTATWLAPFAATPVEWLHKAASQGMNAHLMKVWMLVHAPLILAAYAWTLALAAPALAALGGQATRWPGSALMHARRAWALLTAGIGFGMVWAFEDAMYGQVWHWDPVQTAVFAVWCLLAAHLHGVGGWRPGRTMWRWVPFAALAAAVLTAVAMGVTRNDALASSHRYVGASTWAAHMALATLLLLAGVVSWLRGWRGVAPQPNAARLNLAAWGLRATQLIFVFIGLAAVGHLAWAYFASVQGLPRPDELKPFFETLRSWARGTELPALRAAFAQWDVDGYGLARLLLLPMVAAGLVGGWFFVRRLSAGLGWVTLAAATLACGAVFAQGGLLAHHYAGSGVLSQQIVAVLPRIDAALIAGAYLALGCAAWSVHGAWRNRRTAGYLLPLGLLHLGAVVALWGGLLATALNGYSQHLIDIDGDWQRAHQGYAVRVTGLDVDRTPDGGRTQGKGSFRALAQIEISTPEQGVLQGQTLYRDARSAIAGYAGPVRQICEILDYRYARYADQPGYVLHPFIDRGWARDLQLWVATSSAVAALEGGPQAAQAVVVLRVLPFASLLWIGLTLTSLGALWLALRPQPMHREVQR
ncbi:MAG: cytochrome c biogenesis protein CcsA [Methyloversatilis sp.]|nr:cytochrome c biogenesis protein CcsA [Methyloversatilis sp.]